VAEDTTKRPSGISIDVVAPVDLDALPYVTTLLFVTLGPDPYCAILDSRLGPPTQAAWLARQDVLTGQVEEP
jgi:hypothetical protein